MNVSYKLLQRRSNNDSFQHIFLSIQSPEGLIKDNEWRNEEINRKTRLGYHPDQKTVIHQLAGENVFISFEKVLIQQYPTVLANFHFQNWKYTIMFWYYSWLLLLSQRVATNSVVGAKNVHIYKKPIVKCPFGTPNSRGLTRQMIITFK